MRQKLEFGEMVGGAGDRIIAPFRPNGLGATRITAFLIDTPAIRIDLNSRHINARTISNRHSLQAFLPSTFLRSRKSNGD